MQQFIFAQKAVFRVVRPEHHVNVRMIAFVMESCIPPKLQRRSLHGFCEICLLRAQKCPPACGIVVTETRSIIAPKGVNNRPDVALMRLKLLHRLFQINTVLGSKQTVSAVLFRTRPCGNIAHIDAVCVFVQKLHAVARSDVIHVASGTFCVQKTGFLNQL